MRYVCFENMVKPNISPKDLSETGVEVQFINLDFKKTVFFWVDLGRQLFPS